MATEIRMPQFGVSMDSGTISKWNVKVGDEVHSGDVLAEIETEKLTNEVISEVDGIVLDILAEEWEDVPVQGLMAIIGNNGESVNVTTEERIRATPLARKIANELGADLNDVVPKGTSGRIRAQDVKDWAAKNGSAVEAGIVPEPVHEVNKSGHARVEPVPEDIQLMDGDWTERLSGMRKIVAQRMHAACSEIPQVTQTVKVDVTELFSFRHTINDGRDKRFSVNDFVLKAVAKALRMHPEILVSIENETIIHRAHVNLGVAVAVDNGLIVPVVIDADKMRIEELSCVVGDLVERARNNTLDPNEYKGSTFTVSNLGMYGVDSFTPVINQPDAAILGVCAAQDELWLNEDGNPEIHKVMKLCMTFDHRLLDGAVAANFQNDVRRLLESPLDILI